MSEQELWITSPRYFFMRQKAFFEAERQRSREKWEMARLVAYFASAPHVKEIRKITDVVRFEWDGDASGRSGSKSLDMEGLKNLLAEDRRKWDEEMAELAAQNAASE